MRGSRMTQQKALFPLAFFKLDTQGIPNREVEDILRKPVEDRLGREFN